MQQYENTIKILVVDDSVVVRQVFSKLITADPELELIGSVSLARLGLSLIKNTSVDVLLLDIEMPEMTGIEAIPKFLELDKNLKIIMVSTLTAQNAPIALKALSLGAADYIEKPTSSNELNDYENFKLALIAKIKALGVTKRNASISNNFTLPSYLRNEKIILRQDRKLNFYPKAIAIASSTGGPKAVSDLITSFSKEYLSNLSVFITQHMPPIFTKIFAENLNKIGVIKCVEAEHGMQVEKGCMYVAPGGKHMLAKEELGKVSIMLNDGPQVNFCKPAADPMFDSLANIYRNKLLGIILTGMGKDGVDGGKKIIENGGVILAQDQKTSVVWGMPGKAAVSNICTELLPINEIANYIMIRVR